MNRRTFIKKTTAFTAGVCFPFTLKARAETALADPSAQSVLAVATGTEINTMISGVLNALGGIKQYVKSGQKVVIKPNIGWDRTPEQGANTHPLVVKYLVEAALEAGASEVKVFDRTCNDPRRCYQRSGIQPILEEMRSGKVKCEHMDERKYKKLSIPKGSSLKEWEFYADVLDTDVYINVPVAKHHGLSTLSLGLKNGMGVIGGNRGKLHHGLGQKLADIATIIRPELTVIDATRMLLRNGPQGGRESDVKIGNTILATTDPVAADAYATTLFGMPPSDIDSTVAAHRMALGEMDLTKIQLLKV